MPDIYRISDAWIKENEPPITLELDFEGIGDGSAPVMVDPGTFALVAYLIGRDDLPLYSHARNAISTDPLFGEGTTETITSPEFIWSIDVLWNFTSKRGLLIMILENRKRAQFTFTDPALLLAWVFTIAAHNVTFDGNGLSYAQELATTSGSLRTPRRSSTSW
jgi:hypothetical protein